MSKFKVGQEVFIAKNKYRGKYFDMFVGKIGKVEQVEQIESRHIITVKIKMNEMQVTLPWMSDEILPINKKTKKLMAARIL